MINLNYLTDYIQIEIFKIILNIKKHGENTDNPPIRINVNKIENRTSFRIRTTFSKW